MNSTHDIAISQIATVHAADWPALERLYAPHVRYRDPDGELDGSAAVIEKLRAQSDGLPGWTYEVRRSFSDGDDGAVLEWTLMLPAETGTPLRLDVMTAYDIRDGHIVSERNYWDNVSLLTQLGLMPAGQ
ncbi:MAG TPA: nuclear transport factor 2 family protein [Pseudonocardiaceae bacterium]|nr:nuclear transport factor 2 family protein [Pseudonocardiaceae bacterium]